MDDEPMWAADRVVAPTPGSAITLPATANEFAIKGNHSTIVKGNQFDGRIKTDPHKHVNKFLRICDMFKYRDTKNEVVCLMMFPLSLTGEAKIWLDGLNEGTIENWNELRTLVISQFFPPALFDQLLEEIRSFSQHENETLTDAWLRMKELLRNCHGHNLPKGNIIKIFYHDLIKATQKALNAAADGIFLYKTPNQAYQLLEDKVLIKLDWAKNQKSKPLKRTVAFVDEGPNNTDTDKIMARMDAMTIKMDAQYKELQSRPKQTKPPIIMMMTYPCLVKNKKDSCKLSPECQTMANFPKNSESTISFHQRNHLEEKLFAEFDEFITMTADEKSETDANKEEPEFEKIILNTDYKIKTSLEEPPTDLELKPLLDNLEYVFLEEPSFLPVIISSQLFKENKDKLVTVLKKHKQDFAWNKADILRICLSFCKHKIQMLDDKKPVVQKQRRLNPNMQEVFKK
ncbi:reverse transcriptase domain-containing protein [Tanacetum coccineum]